MTADEQSELAAAIVDQLEQRAGHLRSLVSEARSSLVAADAALVEVQVALGMVIRSAPIAPLRTPKRPTRRPR